MPTKFVTNPRRNPLHLAHPGHFRQGQVVRLRGARKRYVIATDVDPEVFGYHLVALSGGEVGSAPSGIRASDMKLDANQDVSFSGAQAKKLQQKYRRASTMHQEHQRSLVSRRNPDAPSNAVFYATTRGGRYQIVVTPAGEHNGEKFYDLEEFTSGSSSARGYNNLEGLRSRIPNTLHYAKAWDGINYEVKVDTLGLAKKSNPRTVASLASKVERLAKKHGAGHPLTVEAREEFEQAAQAKERRRQSRMPVEAQMWSGMLAKRNPDAATPRAFLSVLRSKLTQHDVKLSAKQPNMYRLGHYLAAAERVEKDMGKSLDSTSRAALHKLRQSLHKRFEMPFAPASAVERQIDAYLASGTMPSLVRKNPGTGRTIPGPSVKVMVERLRLGKTDAQHLKDMMVMGAPRILQMADSMMKGHGVERIPGRPGLQYVNMGDTYDTTLIYDYKTNRFVVSSWGDIVERQPRRFPD